MTQYSHQRVLDWAPEVPRHLPFARREPFIQLCPQTSERSVFAMLQADPGDYPWPNGEQAHLARQTAILARNRKDCRLLAASKPISSS